MLLEIGLFLLLLLVYAIIKDRKPSNMPPGPFEIPFIGNRPPQTCEEFRKLREKYGHIYTTRFGTLRTVMLTRYASSKETMASLECVDRPEMFKIFRLTRNEEGGLFTSTGLQWVHDRRFVLKHLRDLGMGKTYLEIAIQDEARALVDELKSLNGKPVTNPKCIRTAVLNIVWQLAAGKRYDYDSKEVDAIYNIGERYRESSIYIMLEGFFPILKCVPAIIKNKIARTNIVDDFRKEMIAIMQRAVEEHKENLDKDNPRDLIDSYLIEMQQHGDQSEHMRLTALYQIISDLFGAGSDTVANMLRWTVFYMAKYPEIRTRCQKEIDNAVPRDSFVSILNKPDIPYVEAFVAEALRHSSLVIQNVPRTTTKDTYIEGYFIPKGTSVSCDNVFIHHDPEFWTKPDEFNPDRFIDQNGKCNLKDGRYFFFGSGRRQCLGEPLARMEFFIFSASLLQNFNIEVPAGASLKDEFTDENGVRVPVVQEFVFRSRS